MLAIDGKADVIRQMRNRRELRGSVRRVLPLFDHKIVLIRGGTRPTGVHHYGCSNARNRGTCENRLTIRRDVLEESVLVGLKKRLMHPDLAKEFIAEHHRELNRLGATQEGARRQAKRELESVGRETREITDATKPGIRGPTMAAELAALEERKETLERELASEPPPPVRLHPNLAEAYRDKVESLRKALDGDGIRSDAASILRVGEIAALTMGDVVDREGKVRDQVRLNPAITKGGVGRTIFVNKRLEREIARYLAALSALPAPASPLLRTQKRTAFSANTLCQLFGELYRCAGIDGASSNSGRRWYISRLAHAGISSKVIMELAGHKHLGTTQRYIEVNDEMKRAAVEVL